MGVGTNFLDGSGNAVIHLGMDFDTDATWVRFEHNIEADYESVSGAATWTNTDGLLFGMGAGASHRFDDIRLSDSLTVGHNVLAGGGVEQILRQVSWDSNTLARSDRWFHYDQVGSVICRSNASGTLQDTHHQDAFGNTLASWATGLIGGDRPGRHHNTKEFDEDIGLVYMFQRWYSPELGVFVSSAPYPPMMEHRYSFALQAPTHQLDPTGRAVAQASAGVGFNIPLTPFGLGVGGKLDFGFTWDTSGGWRLFAEPGIGPSVGAPGIGFHGGPAGSSEPDAAVYDGWGVEGNAGGGPIQASWGHSITPGTPPALASTPLIGLGAQTPTETVAVQSLITHRVSIDMVLFTPQGMLGYAYGQIENTILNW